MGSSIKYRLIYIKCVMFNSFYDNIFEVDEAADVLSFKEKTLDSCRFVKIVINPNSKTLGANTGWILNLHRRDNSIEYAQIFNKQMKFTQSN